MATLDSYNLGCMLVTSLPNVRYLSGFSGDNTAALITPQGSTLITDSLFREQASREAAGWEVLVYTGGMTQAVADSIPAGARCGFEVTCSFDFYTKLSDAVGERELKPIEDIVEDLRVMKDEKEVELIRTALACASGAYLKAQGLLMPGTPEREMVADLDYRMMLWGPSPLRYTRWHTGTWRNTGSPSTSPTALATGSAWRSTRSRLSPLGQRTRWTPAWCSPSSRGSTSRAGAECASRRWYS